MTMKKLSLSTVVAGAVTALAIMLAAPGAAAVPATDNGDNAAGTQFTAIDYAVKGETPYGTYQNINKQMSVHKR